MITLKVFKKFPYYDGEIKQVSFVPGQPVFDYTRGALMLPEKDTVIVHNCRAVEEKEFHTLIPTDGDFIVIMPMIAGSSSDSKSIVSTVAALVISMYLGPAAGAAASTATGAGAAMTAWNLWGWMAYLGTTVAGGLLINSLTKTTTDDDSSSSTYSWSGISPLTGENNPIPVVFGTVRVAGQVIAEHTITDGTDSYLHMLIEAGEGPCDYTGDGEDDNCTGIDNIQISDNDLDNYTGITVYKRAGLNDQSLIPNFEDTRVEQSIAVELENDSVWHTFTTTGDTGSGLEITFTLAGLYGISSSGNKYANEIQLEIQYKLATNTAWTTYQGRDRISAFRYSDYYFYHDGTSVPFNVGDTIYLVVSGSLLSTTVQDISYSTRSSGSSEDPDINIVVVKVGRTVSSKMKEVEYIVDYLSIQGKYTSQFSKAYQIDTGVIGQYDVHCRCIYKLTEDDTDAHTIYWSTLSHIFYDDFTYPGCTLLSVQALASDLISGSTPTVTYELTRSYVLVYNPDTAAYEQKAATNPAWALYWMLHRAYYIKNINTDEWEYVVRGVPAVRIIYSEFEAWAAFCDERELTVNIYFDTTQKISEAKDYIEELGRGKVMHRGTKYGCIFDEPADKDADDNIIPSQVFNMSNIVLDSFSQQYVDISDRATGIEVTFYDKDNDYEATKILVPGDDYDDSSALDNPTQLTLTGCTNYEQAWKEAKYRLRLNNYLVCSAAWQSGIDAIVSSMGQVVMVQHDVPAWGWHGRVVSATETSVTIDTPIINEDETIFTLESGKTYQILIQMADDSKVYKTVTGLDTTGTIITVSVSFAADTDENAAYVDSTHFETTGDMTTIYTADLEIQLIHDYFDYVGTVVSSSYDSETGKTTVEVTDNPIVDSLSSVRYAWTRPSKDDLINFGETQTMSRPFKISEIKRDGNMMYTISGLEYIDAVYTEATDVPDIEYSTIDPIFEVENLTLTEDTYLQQDGTVISQINVSWTYPTGRQADQCRVYYSEDDELTWNYSGSTVSTNYTILSVKTGVTYLVKVLVVKTPITSSGTISDAITIVGKDYPPGDVQALTITQTDNILTFTITPPDDPDLNHYVIKMGATWATAVDFAESITTQFTENAPQAGTTTFWCIAVDNSGNESETPASYTIAVLESDVYNVIVKETVDTRDWTFEGMYRCPYNPSCLKIDSVEKLEDFTYFCDAFVNGHTLQDDAYALAEAIDLGPNVVEDGSYFYDLLGNWYINDQYTLDDYDEFLEAMIDAYTPVSVTYKLNTRLTVTPDYDQDANNSVSEQYRTSLNGTVWGSWIDLVNHQIFGRYVQVKFLPLSTDGLTNVYLCGATISIDVPDVEEAVPDFEIAASGWTQYDLSKRFYNAPRLALFTRDSDGKDCRKWINGGVAVQETDGTWYFEIKCLDIDTGEQIAGIGYGRVEGF